MNTNELLRISGHLFACFAISSQIYPQEKADVLNISDNGIESIECDGCNIVFFQSLTQIKFVVAVGKETAIATVKEKLYDIYLAFSDYCSKNPFYNVSC